MRLLFCFVLFPFGSILWVVGGCCLTSFVANCFLVLRVLGGVGLKRLSRVVTSLSMSMSMSMRSCVFAPGLSKPQWLVFPFAFSSK